MSLSGGHVGTFDGKTARENLKQGRKKMHAQKSDKTAWEDQQHPRLKRNERSKTNKLRGKK